MTDIDKQWYAVHCLPKITTCIMVMHIHLIGDVIRLIKHLKVSHSSSPRTKRWKSSALRARLQLLRHFCSRFLGMSEHTYGTKAQDSVDSSKILNYLRHEFCCFVFHLSKWLQFLFYNTITYHSATFEFSIYTIVNKKCSHFLLVVHYSCPQQVFTILKYWSFLIDILHILLTTLHKSYNNKSSINKYWIN